MAEIFEVRRHSRRGEGKSLSEEGIALARRAAATLLPRYHAYYTSPKRRAIDTLELLGATSYKIIPEFGTLPKDIDEHQEHVEALMNRTECSVLEAYLAIPATRLVLEQFGQAFFAQVCELAHALRPGHNALAVSHGGSIEAAALAAMPEWDLEDLGGQLVECEGVRFWFQDRIFTRVERVRL